MKVKCINAHDSNGLLELGRIYEATLCKAPSVDGGPKYKLEGLEWPWWVARFRVVPDAPPEPSFDHSSPNDLRATGWIVAQHYDFTIAGVKFTSWLFTKGYHAVRGEGTSDFGALNQIREAIAKLGL